MPPKLSGAPWSREYDLELARRRRGHRGVEWHHGGAAVPVSRCSTSSAGKNQHQARDAGRVEERAGIDGVGGYRASLGQGPPRW